MDNDKKIFIPSFKFERKTRAFNIVLWGFVALISMFTIGGIFCFHLMVCSIADIVSTFISDNMNIFTLLIFILAIIFGIFLFKFQNALLHSYKFQNNQIIKGKILNPDKVSNVNLAVNAATTKYMVKNIGNPKNVMTANTISNMSNILELISLNTKFEFVEQYFDTELYRKKIYNNPRLLKETKYSLVYICDNNKKLKIPKVYEGMNVTFDNKKSTSLVGRILVRSLVVFLIFSLLSIGDLVIGYNNNSHYISSISEVYSNIEYNLSSYGYSVKKINEKCYEFEKIVSNDRTSRLKYIFDKNGNIIDVNIDLYFYTSDNIEPELEFIIKSLNDNFTDYEINSFISEIISCINNSCSYSKLISEKNTLRIGTSGGSIQLHN